MPMTRMIILAAGAATLLQAGCAATPQDEFAQRPPTLRVAQAALDAGSPSIALSVADANLTIDPRNSEAIVYRGEALAALGRNDLARLEYERALSIDAQSPSAALGLARLALPSDPAYAARLLGPLVVRDVANAAVYNDLGIARDLLGRHAEAQANYREALAADPGMRAALVNLARSLALEHAR